VYRLKKKASGLYILTGKKKRARLYKNNLISPASLIYALLKKIKNVRWIFLAGTNQNLSSVIRNNVVKKERRARSHWWSLENLAYLCESQQTAQTHFNGFLPPHDGMCHLA
jgi:hypothetical protein